MDVEICGGTMRVIASREDLAVIKRFLALLENGRGVAQHPEHPPRAPPQLTLPGLEESASGASSGTDARPSALGRVPLVLQSMDE